MSLTNLTPVDVECQENSSPGATNSASEGSPKNDFNFTLYGAPAPIRRTRTVIQRKKGHTTITLRPVDLHPTMAGGAAKLLAEDTTLDLGFAHDENFDMIHPYSQINESTSSTTRSSIYFLNNGVDSECTSCETFTNDSGKSEAVAEALPRDSSATNIKETNVITKNNSRSSTTTYDSSSKSDCGSFESRDEDDDETKGEWNTFWQSYSKPDGFKLNDFLKLKELNKIRQSSESDTSHIDFELSKTRPRKKSKCPAVQRVIMSTSDAIEAAKCARRLSEILSMAIRRSSLPCTSRNEPEHHQQDETQTIPTPPPLPYSARSKNLSRSKSDSKINENEILNAASLISQRLQLKPLKFENCVEVEIRTKDHANVAEILQKVINRRRDIIMPPEDRLSTCQSNRSDWSCID